MTETPLLPEKWYVKTGDYEHDVINHYRIDIAKYRSTLFDFNEYDIMFEDGSGGDLRTQEGRIELSVNQFKEHVLGIKPEPVIEEPQDYTYLIEFLNNKQIK